MSVLSRHAKKTLINTLKPVQVHPSPAARRKQLKKAQTLKGKLKKNTQTRSLDPGEDLTPYTQSQQKQGSGAPTKKGMMIDRKAG